MLEQNDDSDIQEGAGGSTSFLDSYIKHTFTQDGEYIIGIGQYLSEATNGKLAPILGTPLTTNSKYNLQVSIANHVPGSDGSLNKFEPNNGSIPILQEDKRKGILFASINRE